MYRCGDDGVPSFVETGAPTDDELQALLQTVIARLMKTLTRRGAPAVTNTTSRAPTPCAAGAAVRAMAARGRETQAQPRGQGSDQPL